MPAGQIATPAGALVSTVTEPLQGPAKMPSAPQFRVCTASGRSRLAAITRLAKLSGDPELPIGLPITRKLDSRPETCLTTVSPPATAAPTAAWASAVDWPSVAATDGGD